jgi:predicted TIM-barrel fold metal-dependent hydrolase
MNPCPRCGGENLRVKKYMCNTCSKAYERERWAKLTDEKKRAKWLKMKYDLSFEDYKTKYEEQGGRCECCSIEISITQKDNGHTTACVDHNHKTGKVRGLLCNHCNRALGLLKEDIEVMKKLISYLETHDG